MSNQEEKSRANVATQAEDASVNVESQTTAAGRGAAKKHLKGERTANAGAEEAARSIVAEGERTAEPTPTDETPRITKYDFTRPTTISKRFKQTFATLNESFAKQLSFNLSNLLRTNVEVQFQNIEETLFKDYVNALENPSCVGIFSAQPLKGQAILTIDARLMFIMLDRLFGGEGKPIDEIRDFTETETEVFTLVLNRILNDFREVSKRVVEMDVSLSRVESNPSFINIMTGGEQAIQITLGITIGENGGPMSICFPMLGFDSVMDRFDPREERITKKHGEDSEDREKILSTMRETQVEIIAELGKTKMSVNALLNLQAGDTVILDHAVSVPIPVKVGRTTVFLGEPGNSQNRRAIKILGRTTDGGQT